MSLGHPDAPPAYGETTTGAVSPAADRRVTYVTVDPRDPGVRQVGGQRGRTRSRTGRNATDLPPCPGRGRQPPARTSGTRLTPTVPSMRGALSRAPRPLTFRRRRSAGAQQLGGVLRHDVVDEEAHRRLGAGQVLELVGGPP